jgi:opacity protein-like surface antigen
MKRLRVAATALVVLVLLCANAAEAAPESWYGYFGLGGSFNSYPSEVEKTLNLVGDAKNENVQLCLDMFGVYWPLPDRPRSLLGFVVNGVADSREQDRKSVRINTYLMGLSSMHSYGSEAGAGFFIRADLGMAWYDVSSSEVPSYESGKGFGGLVGGGYGIRLGEGARLLLNVNYALRFAGGDDLRTFGMSVGCLF